MVPEDTIASLVQEISERMRDPRYSELAVGRFAMEQPNLSRYLTANTSLIGGEGVIVGAFHAELVRECVEKSHAAPMEVGFDAIDVAAQGDPIKKLEILEPALAAYLGSNLEEGQGALHKVLCVVALSLVSAHTR